MKILLAHNFYQQSGGEDAVFAMERDLLKDRGHQVLPFTIHNNDIHDMRLLQAGGRAIWNKEVYKRMRQLIRDHNPDILHVHNFWPLLSPSVFEAAKAEGKPVVQTLHNYRLLCPSSTHFYRDGEICEKCINKQFPYHGIRHACYRDSRTQSLVLASVLGLNHLRKTWHKDIGLFIALTEFARQKFIQGGFSPERIVVKPNAIHPDPGERNGCNGTYALFAGRIGEEKGILTLMKAWSQLESIPLLVIGDGPVFDGVKSSIALEKMKQIKLLGRKKRMELLQLMRKARFLVFPSELYEGFPVTIVEAFACGVPVLASKLGAMAEIVVDGKTGRHFRPGDPADLASIVRWAWTNPEKLCTLGRNARHEYETKYSADRNFQQLMKIYKMAMESRSTDEY